MEQNSGFYRFYEEDKTVEYEHLFTLIMGKTRRQCTARGSSSLSTGFNDYFSNNQYRLFIDRVLRSRINCQNALTVNCPLNVCYFKLSVFKKDQALIRHICERRLVGSQSW